MMTPSQERSLLDATAAGLDDDLRAAYRQLLALIEGGMAPRDAVQAVIDTFEGEYAELLADGFSAILDRSIGTESVLALKVSDVTLSARLYAEASDVAAVVQNIVDRHARGWQDARTLTLELYEGYGFRADEPIKWSPRNPRLPQYLRAELLTDPGLAGDLRRHFTKVHAQKLKTPALRAAYLEYLEALEAGKGAKALARKIDVAFHERMRYHAARIAQTELHRAYAERQAVELMDDPDVEFVQWRMSATHPRVDICDYFAKVDRYGLGPGVYPKAAAPIAPSHPFCRCNLAPRLDIPSGARYLDNPEAGRAWLQQQGLTAGAQVMGSRARLQQALSGADPVALWNARSDPAYRIRTVGEVERDGWPVR